MNEGEDENENENFHQLSVFENGTISSRPQIKILDGMNSQLKFDSIQDKFS
jgi:hypothetical protein